MKLVRGKSYIIEFYGKEKEAMFYGANENGIDAFVLKRKTKRPDGISTKYAWSTDSKVLREI